MKTDKEKAASGLGRIYMCLYFTMRHLEIITVSMPYELDFIETADYDEIIRGLEATKEHLLKLVSQADEDSRHLMSLGAIRARGQALYQKMT
jgi:hypothetical protein